MADAHDGTEIDLTTGGSLTNGQTLTAAETCTVDAEQDIVHMVMDGILGHSLGLLCKMD